MKTIMDIETANIPIIDFNLLSQDRDLLIKTLGDGFKECGFVAIKNHGIDPELFNKNYELLEKVFSLDEGIKQSYNRPELGSQRGYLPLAGEIHPGSSFRDIKTCWQVGRNNSTNVYPKEVPDFCQYNYQLFLELEAVGISIIDCLDEYLGANGQLVKLVKNENNTPIGNHLFRSIFYPKIEPQFQQEIVRDGVIIRGAAHVDLNLITLLPTSTNEGLQILQKDKTWLSVNVPPSHLIVNIADMLQLITKGTDKELVSTPHRVIATDKTMNESRYSMPMFIHPSHKLPLVNLKTNTVVELPNGITLDKAGKYVHWRLMCILPQGTVPSFEEWEEENNLLE